MKRLINEISLKKQNFIYKEKVSSNEKFLIRINVHLIDLILGKIKYQNWNLINEALNTTFTHVFFRKEGCEYQAQYFVNVHDLYSPLYKDKPSISSNNKDSLSLLKRIKSTPNAFEYNNDIYIELLMLRKVFIERIVELELISDNSILQFINELLMKLETRFEFNLRRINRSPITSVEQIAN